MSYLFYNSALSPSCRSTAYRSSEPSLVASSDSLRPQRSVSPAYSDDEDELEQQPQDLGCALTGEHLNFGADYISPRTHKSLGFFHGVTIRLGEGSFAYQAIRQGLLDVRKGEIGREELWYMIKTVMPDGNDDLLNGFYGYCFRPAHDDEEPTSTPSSIHRTRANAPPLAIWRSPEAKKGVWTASARLVADLSTPLPTRASVLTPTVTVKSFNHHEPSKYACPRSPLSPPKRQVATPLGSSKEPKVKARFVHAICGRKFQRRDGVKVHHFGQQGDAPHPVNGCWNKSSRPDRAWDEDPSCWIDPSKQRTRYVLPKPDLQPVLNARNAEDAEDEDDLIPSPLDDTSGDPTFHEAALEEEAQSMHIPKKRPLEGPFGYSAPKRASRNRRTSMSSTISAAREDSPLYSNDVKPTDYKAFALGLRPRKLTR